MLVNPVEFLVHLQVEIKIQNDSAYEKDIYHAYLKASSYLNDIEMFGEIENDVFPYSYYELTYFAKIKSDNYKHLLKRNASDIKDYFSNTKRPIEISQLYKKSN